MPGVMGVAGVTGCASGLARPAVIRGLGAPAAAGAGGRAAPVLPLTGPRSALAWLALIGCPAPRSASTTMCLGSTRSMGMVTAGGGEGWLPGRDDCTYISCTTDSAVTSLRLGILTGVVCPRIAFLSDSASLASRFIQGSSARLGLSCSKSPQSFSLSSTQRRKCSRSALARLGSEASAAP